MVLLIIITSIGIYDVNTSNSEHNNGKDLIVYRIRRRDVQNLSSSSTIPLTSTNSTLSENDHGIDKQQDEKKLESIPFS